MSKTASESLSWREVYGLVKKIPRGRVLTYAQLARALHLRGGARTAGRAMAACPAGQGIPWHRVVGAGGRILVREPYASLQRRLLRSEGVRLVPFPRIGTALAETRVDVHRHNWVPRSRKRPEKPKRK